MGLVIGDKQRKYRAEGFLSASSWLAGTLPKT